MYRKSTRQRVALIALLAATATIVTLDFSRNPGGPVRRARDVAVGVVAPLQDGLSRVFRPVIGFVSAIGEIGQLRSENARLSSKVETLEAQQRRVPEYIRENERLLDLYQLKDWATGKTVVARVIARGPANNEWTAFLDKGSEEGIAENMAVVTSEGLVGRVVIAGPKYSKILMVIDPQHAVGARLSNTGETGAVSGRGDDDLRFELIDPETKVDSGENVTTSGYDRGIYPAGIPVGRVSLSFKSKDGLTQTAFVKPFVDFTRLGLVKVLLESGPTASPSARP